ncbi:Wzz/FepE/Etk N-terminal domain-containing protein [Desulfothermus naphthae]
MEERWEEEEIDLYELWLVIVKYKKMILGLTFGVAFAVAVLSLFMTNIYKSEATILPVGNNEQISGALAGLGGLAQMAGISLPSGGSSSEIIALLNSDILKEKVILNYKILPLLLYEQWDSEKNTWKKPNPIIKWFKGVIRSLQPSNRESIKESDVPTLEDGIREFEDIFNVQEDKKLGTISISIEYPDPEICAKVVKYILDTLREHMSEEAIRIAQKNKRLLKQELLKTSDPTIQQKLYTLIAKQVETITMAKVNENFAFKIIDPPRVPDKKYKPRRTLIVVVSFITTLFLSIFLAFFLEYINNVKQRSGAKDLVEGAVKNEKN